MNNLTLSEARRWLGLPSRESDTANNAITVSIDSRTLTPGALYIAIRGDRYDGHDFIAEAEKKGAKALLVDHKVDSNLPQLIVADTRKALGQLAKCYAQQFTIPKVGVTGSSGKTTTKDMLGCIFSECGHPLVTEGSFNNDIGLPLTLLRLTDRCDFAVLELGTNHPGEIAVLAGLVSLDAAVITYAGPSHLEGLKTVEGVAKEKGMIYSALGDAGTAVINLDDEFAGYWQSINQGRRCLTFGFDECAEVRATQVVVQKDASPIFTLVTPDGEASIQLSLLGRHNVANALAAAATATAVGVDLAAIKAGLEATQPAARRMQSYLGYRGVRILDDCYNANPSSVEAALDVLAHCEGEKIFVMGDMGELGEEAIQFHKQVGRAARDAGIDALFAYGTFTAATVEAFGSGAHHFTSYDALSSMLRDRLQSGTTLLVKGSRVAEMEHVINTLTKDVN